MSIFEKLFNSLLNEELINSAVTWNTGLPQYHMSVFPKTQNPSKPTARHMRHVVKDPGFRKHAQTVPDMHRADPTAIQKVNNPSIGLLRFSAMRTPREWLIKISS